MKRIAGVFLFVFVATFVRAQDSSKVITHEIGFNSVSLIKQLISNNPTSTLPQLPYDVFYNLYFNDLIGARIGLGITNLHSETQIQGQSLPRTFDQKSLNLRAGVSYNFVKSKRVTLNGFADVIFEKFSSESVNTSTTQTFPNPVQTFTDKSYNKINGIGGEAGVGVKFNLVKHLSIYAEVPIVFLTEKSTSGIATNRPGVIPQPDNKSTTSLTSIILPTTIYLVLRF
ncbi:MAG: outer membrane beta-barrel protein [Bacteroidota bacterium]